MKLAKLLDLPGSILGKISNCFNYDLLYQSMIKDPKKVRNHRRSALNQQRRKKLKKSQNSNHEMGFDYKDLMEQNLTFP
jgi:hypothetical protein